MKIIKATETEIKILEAVKKAKARGITVKDGSWSVKWSEEECKFVPVNNCCCPLGAVLITAEDMPANVIDLKEGEEDGEALCRAAAGYLEKDYEWCDRFVEAFDSPESAKPGKSGDRAALKVRELIYDEDHGITK